MKDEEIQNKKEGSSDTSSLGKGRYRFYALAAILLLAFWSMVTGTVTLKWSAGNLSHLSDEMDVPMHDDLDILEMEEREKVVRRLWDIYIHNQRIRLPRFWQEAFQAAYEDMESETPGVRETAISEIAKMSMRMIDLDSATEPLEDITGSKKNTQGTKGKAAHTARREK